MVGSGRRGGDVAIQEVVAQWLMVEGSPVTADAGTIGSFSVFQMGG